MSRIQSKADRIGNQQDLLLYLTLMIRYTSKAMDVMD